MMRKWGRLPDVRTGDPAVDSALQRQRTALEQFLGGVSDGDSGLALAGSDSVSVNKTAGGGNQVDLKPGGVGPSALNADVAGGGLTGGAGDPLAVDFVRERPSGVVDGANVTFSLSSAPLAKTEVVFSDGLQTSAYSLSEKTLTFSAAPTASVFATYFKA